MHISELFLKLVQIDSPSGHEKLMAQFIQKWLKMNEFSYSVDSVGNIYAHNRIKKGTPLLLCAHMDTVQPGCGIKPQIKDGIITSDGTTILGADNKAALAAILHAVEHMKINRSIELLFTVKEETGGGVEFFPFEWIQAKKCIIFDKSSPLGGIVLSSPYIYNFHIELIGKAAHASLPQLGINAFTPAFSTLSKIPIGILDAGKTTINIGIIKGGTGINTIPDKMQISGEVRSYSKRVFASHLRKIQAAFESSARKNHVSCTFSKDGYCSGYVFTKNDTFIEQIKNIYIDMGLKPAYFEHSGISDANVLNEHRIQTINLTDGAQNPHTKDERISVNTLEKLSQIIVSCITRL